MAIAVQREADRGVPGPHRNLFRGGACGDPKRHGRVAKVMNAKAGKPGRVGGQPPDPVAEGDDAQGATLGRGEDGTVHGVPREPGVYAIHFNNGSSYVGSTIDSMHGRVDRAFTDKKHAVFLAGLTLQDISNVQFWDSRTSPNGPCGESSRCSSTTSGTPAVPC
jgi:hypothetical protein